MLGPSTGGAAEVAPWQIGNTSGNSSHQPYPPLGDGDSSANVTRSCVNAMGACHVQSRRLPGSRATIFGAGGAGKVTGRPQTVPSDEAIVFAPGQERGMVLGDGRVSSKIDRRPIESEKRLRTIGSPPRCCRNLTCWCGATSAASDGPLARLGSIVAGGLKSALRSPPWINPPPVGVEMSCAGSWSSSLSWLSASPRPMRAGVGIATITVTIPKYTLSHRSVPAR